MKASEVSHHHEHRAPRLGFFDPRHVHETLFFLINRWLGTMLICSMRYVLQIAAVCTCIVVS